MGILQSPVKVQEKVSAPSNVQRRSMQADLANLKPLKPHGLGGFSEFRDPSGQTDSNGGRSGKTGTKRGTDADSDEDIDVKDEPDLKVEESEAKDTMLSPEDARRQVELADGVQKIRVSICVHSFTRCDFLGTK